MSRNYKSSYAKCEKFCAKEAAPVSSSDSQMKSSHWFVLESLSKMQPMESQEGSAR